jgi:hypothetical protein
LSGVPLNLFTSYHFAHTFNHARIYPNTTWVGALPEAKTLTEVLLNRSDFSFVAFGYEARNNFIISPIKDQLLYFSNFKMVLHNVCVFSFPSLSFLFSLFSFLFTTLPISSNCYVSKVLCVRLCKPTTAL